MSTTVVHAQPPWLRIESKSKPGRFYWARADGSSQWARPAARELVDPHAHCSGVLGRLPQQDVLSKIILGQYADPADAARVALSSRGAYAAAADPRAWSARLSDPLTPDPFRAFADPARRVDAPRIMRCDARGRQLYLERSVRRADSFL